MHCHWEYFGNPGVTFKQNIWCITRRAKPILSQRIKEEENRDGDECDGMVSTVWFRKKCFIGSSDCKMYLTNFYFPLSLILKIPGECLQGWKRVNNVVWCCPELQSISTISLLSFLSVFISHCPTLFVRHLPPLCLTLSCLRASICLQSFPPSPPLLCSLHPLQISSFPSSPSHPQLLLHLSQFDSSHDRCSYQSQKPRLVRDEWSQRRCSSASPSLSLSFICLGFLPLTNLFQLISPPKWPPPPN